MESRARTFALAMILETSLGFLGLAVAWMGGISLHEQLQLSQAAVLRGAAASLPMIVMLVVLTRSRWAPLVELRQLVEGLVRELFAKSNWLELALLSTAAGVGEELLFRGAMQPWLARWTEPLVAIVVVGLLFGLAHALSTTYFFLATIIGCYFGWLTHAYNDLVAPIVAHALYDFVALMVVQRRVAQQDARSCSGDQD